MKQVNRFILMSLLFSTIIGFIVLLYRLLINMFDWWLINGKIIFGTFFNTGCFSDNGRASFTSTHCKETLLIDDAILRECLIFSLHSISQIR